MIIILDSLDQEQANTFSLVLKASGIWNRVVVAKNGLGIAVADLHADSARDAIDRYQGENLISEDELASPPALSTPINLSGVAVAFVLLSIHWAVLTSAAPQDYISVFGANARRILEGEVYRCATALLMHADVAHIAGNMVGVALFGGAVCAITGCGVGWLMILGCGILGNLINALAYGTGHLSVGASTAVFGAVGILCALQAVNAVKTGKGWQRIVVIIGAGVALLGFLGTSARSDLGGHLFGFLSGILIGGVYGLGVRHSIGTRGQVLGGILAVSILLLSWIQGALT
jgi:membrane associated rhomboid family serine protease